MILALLQSDDVNSSPNQAPSHMLKELARICIGVPRNDGSQNDGAHSRSEATHTHHPDILVIIPAFQNPRQLEQCLDAIAQQTIAHRIKIYIRDNTDDNILYTAAINEGLKAGLASNNINYFLILNQDCYLKTDAIEMLLGLLENHPEVGITVPIQLDSKNPEDVVWGGANQSFPSGRCFMGSVDEAPAPFETPWASGAAALIRKEVVIQIGLMDENMRFICSDSDYSFSARARGWKIVCVPSARCIHEDGAAKRGVSPTLRAIMAQDITYFSEKWITGDLFLRLEYNPDKLDISGYRKERDRYLNQLTSSQLDPDAA